MVGSKEFLSNVNQYELTPNQLLEFIGLKDVTEVRARLQQTSLSSSSLVNSKSFIPEWGITLEQFAKIVTRLVPKIKPDKFFTDRLGDEFRVEIADVKFLEAWLRNMYGDDLIIYLNGSDMMKATKALSLCRELNTLFTPRSQI